MLVSEERIYHLAHLVFDGLYKDDLLDYENDEKVLKLIRSFLLEYFSKDEKIDQIVRNKIKSQSKVIYEGSNEWDIIYNKYYKEELKKML